MCASTRSGNAPTRPGIAPTRPVGKTRRSLVERNTLLNFLNLLSLSFLEGSLFLVVYPALAGLCALFLLTLRHLARHGQPTDSTWTLSETAFLTGGPHSALVAALMHLDVTGRLAIRGNRCEANDTRQSGDRLEKAILHKARKPTDFSALATSSAIQYALRETAQDLQKRGWLASASSAELYLHSLLLCWFLLVSIGIARLVLGITSNSYVGAEMLGVLVLFFLLILKRPVITRAAEIHLENLRSQHSGGGAETFALFGTGGLAVPPLPRPPIPWKDWLKTGPSDDFYVNGVD